MKIQKWILLHHVDFPKQRMGSCICQQKPPLRGVGQSFTVGLQDTERCPLALGGWTACPEASDWHGHVTQKQLPGIAHAGDTADLQPEGTACLESALGWGLLPEEEQPAWSCRRQREEEAKGATAASLYRCKASFKPPKKRKGLSFSCAFADDGSSGVLQLLHSTLFSLYPLARVFPISIPPDALHLLIK